MTGDSGFRALLLTLGLAGCAVHPTPDVSHFAENSGGNSFEVFHRTVNAPDTLVLPVIHDRQTEGPACGAHALASVVNYWKGSGTLNGSALFRQTPPQNPSGYSMAELLTLAHAQGLLASAVRLDNTAIRHELDSGRPVLIPVQLPSVYVQQHTLLPGANVPVLGLATGALVNQAARVSERSHLAMVNHYLLIVGYESDTFVVVEPVYGYRTIRLNRLERFRQPFGDAAIVFSAPGNAAPAHTSAAAAVN